jgi:hypothetical protein
MMQFKFLHDLVQDLLDEHEYRFSKNSTSLMIASYFGLRGVKHLLELDGIDLNSMDGTYIGRHSLGLQETALMLLSSY